MSETIDRTAATDAEFQARIAPFDPVRISPDGRDVAIRRGPDEWRVTNGGLYRDQHVADWTPLERVEGAPADVADPAAAVARVEALTYANDDGTEWQHLYGCEGEPECPACWAASIRAALTGPTS